MLEELRALNVHLPSTTVADLQSEAEAQRSACATSLAVLARYFDNVFGLLVGNKDVEIRASASISSEEEKAIRAQVQFVLKDQQAQIRRAIH